MATNTSALKTFAQETRKKLISLITTKMQFVLGADTAELRGYEREIGELRKQIEAKTEKVVIEEVAYTWFNRVMALRFMDANGYSAPMIVTPAAGQTRPEILQEAMGGNIDEELMLTPEEKLLPEAKLYRKLLVAVCNKQMSQPMPFLFEHISDYTELLLPDDLLSAQSFVSDIRNGMTDEDCQNVELIGWLYQFYITDRKADAETKKSKKGGLKSDEQAAATQLFTPHWIVRYMVENSLGRIWMTLHPESRLVDNMPYYIPTPEGQTDTIPEDIHQAKDIRFIDPCMGSGHILVYAFDLFCKMYEEEGQMTRDIPSLILRNNLYGIDIDHRCYQLATFALTMKARAYDRRYLRHTVMPNVIALEPIDRITIESTGAWPNNSLMWQFEHIDTIGSLLKVTPEECAAIHVEKGLFGIRQQIMKTQAEYLSRQYHCVVTNPPYLGKGFCDVLKNYIVNQFPNSKADLYASFIERLSCLPSANGYIGMVTMESWMFLPTYTDLRNHILENVFIQSLSHFDWHIMRIAFGTVAFVLQNKRCANEKGVYSYLNRNEVDLNLELPYVFPNKENGKYSIKSQHDFKRMPCSVYGYWVSEKILESFEKSTLEKMARIVIGIKTGDNDLFLKQWHEVSFDNIGTGMDSLESINASSFKWFPYVKGGDYRKWYGNQDLVINWEDNGKNMLDHTNKNGVQDARIRQSNFGDYGKEFLTWSRITSSSLSIRYVPKGVLFDCNSPSIYERKCNLYLILGLLSSKVSKSILQLLAPTITFQIQDIRSIPYIEDAERSSLIKKLVEENVSISKYDWDSHETSWDFKRNPLWEQQLEVFVDELSDTMPNLTVDDIEDYHAPDLLQPLSVLVANYESKWEDLFYKLHRNEEELNRKFIEIYGLQDELTPDVPLNEVTILQKGEISIERVQSPNSLGAMPSEEEIGRSQISIEDNLVVWHDDVVIKQFISWLVGCFMGRYSADQPGLIIASQGQKVADLDLKKQTIEIDDDGIIPVIMEEDFFTDDMTQRIEAAVKALFGEKYFHDNMKFIRTAIGMPLRDYLYKNFYADHQQMYSVKGAKRPIYWLFNSAMGDKRKKGYFKALVYMHRLEADTLSKLHADYVHPYLQKVEQQLVEAEDNALRDDLTGKQKKNALDLAETLRDKVREVKAFETQLVEMASARITIDLDDGVKANYPKFYPLVEPIKGLESSNDD